MLAVIVLIPGCSSSGSGGTVGASASPIVTKEAASAPKSAAEVRAMLTQAGVGCTSFKTVPKERRQMGYDNAADFESCEIDGEDVNIAVWKDEAQQENWQGFTKQFGCGMGKAFGVTNIAYVNGNLWTVSELSQTVTDKIAAATGAEPVHIKCE